VICTHNYMHNIAPHAFYSYTEMGP
jgi:hypothetical protein